MAMPNVPYNADPRRGTGRTTNVVLLTVRLALDNPNVNILCLDHLTHGVGSFGAEIGDVNVRDKVTAILDVLGVAYDVTGDYVRVRPFPSRRPYMQLSLAELKQEPLPQVKDPQPSPAD